MMRIHYKKIKINTYAFYTILFIIITPIIFFSFFLEKKSLIWNNDGLRQHYIAFMHFGNWGRQIIRSILFDHKFQIPLWDFQVGYGSDIITTFHYYTIGDPLNLLSVFVPEQYAEYLYQALILIRFYLSGLSYVYFCREMKKERIGTLAGAFQYVFCGFLLFAGIRHPFFINPMIYLPLLLTGSERIFQKKKPTLFIFMVFLSAISNFYFFYMLVFAVCFYVAVRFFSLRHSRFLKELCSIVFRFFGYSCIGLSMSSVILLPVLLQFFSTNRNTSSQNYTMLYRPGYYVNLVLSVLTADKIGNWTMLGFSTVSILAIFTLFTIKNKYKTLKITFCIMSIMLCVPFFGKALNGFSYIANRWCFIYAALISYILTTVWEDIMRLKKIFRRILWSGCFCYFILFIAYKENNSQKIIIGLILLSSLILLEIKRNVRLTSCCMFCLSLIHICVNAFFLYGSHGNNYMSQFADIHKAYENITICPAKALQCSVPSENSNQMFFRYETDDFTNVNASTVIGEHGLSYYWSLENSHISDYLMDMSIKSFIVFNYRDLDHRTYLDALAGVKYFIRTNSNVIPYGYQYLGSVSLSGQKKYEIYENTYALPLGYTYKSYIPIDDYNKMSPQKRQEALMQGIVLETDEKDNFGHIPQAKPVFTHKSVDYSIQNSKNLSIAPDGSFDVKKEGASVTLSFNGLDGCETYLFLKGTSVRMKNLFTNDITLNISSDESSNTMRHMTDSHKNYKGQSDYLVCLGYHEKAQKNITITFPKKGTYFFKDIEIICQPMKNYSSQTAALKEDILEQETIETNKVYGSIRLSEDKILCLSIPYSRGWSAFVDGKKAELLKANRMYMALPLAKGEHTIELRYKTPGLSAGITFILIGCIIFFFIFVTKASWKAYPPSSDINPASFSPFEPK